MSKSGNRISDFYWLIQLQEYIVLGCHVVWCFNFISQQSAVQPAGSRACFKEEEDGLKVHSK